MVEEEEEQKQLKELSVSVPPDSQGLSLMYNLLLNHHPRCFSFLPLCTLVVNLLCSSFTHSSASTVDRLAIDYSNA